METGSRWQDAMLKDAIHFPCHGHMVHISYASLYFPKSCSEDAGLDPIYQTELFQ